MLDGLNNTTYWFKETKAPKDYNLPSALFDIEVKPTAYTDAENHGDYMETAQSLTLTTIVKMEAYKTQPV